MRGRLPGTLLLFHNFIRGCCSGGATLDLDSLSRPETGRVLWQDYPLLGPALLPGLPPQPGQAPVRAGQVRAEGPGITWYSHRLQKSVGLRLIPKTADLQGISSCSFLQDTGLRLARGELRLRCPARADRGRNPRQRCRAGKRPAPRGSCTMGRAGGQKA